MCFHHHDVCVSLAFSFGLFFFFFLLPRLFVLLEPSDSLVTGSLVSIIFGVDTVVTPSSCPTSVLSVSKASLSIFGISFSCFGLLSPSETGLAEGLGFDPVAFFEIFFFGRFFHYLSSRFKRCCFHRNLLLLFFFLRSFLLFINLFFFR